jgi:hypothetical protein
MALPNGTTISMSQINTELGYPATYLISMNSILVRQLADRTSGSISMSNFWGKSSGFSTFAFDNGSSFSVSNVQGGFSLASIRFGPDGSILKEGNTSSSGPTAYGSPLTSGLGSRYEISLTNIDVYNLGAISAFVAFGVSYPLNTGGPRPTTPWYELSSNQDVYISSNSGSRGDVGFEVRIRHITSSTTITRGGSMTALSL